MNTILVVEDEAAVRANLVEILEGEGFRVLEAGHGHEGLRLAREHLPDVVLCDIMMPDLDGHDVLEALRRDAATARLPVVFLTARASREDVRTGMSLGADDYLTKPFTRRELLAALKARLERKALLARDIQTAGDELRSSLALALPHELRTPLNGIVGMSELLADETEERTPEQTREIARLICDAADRLQNVVERFLLYARLEIAARDSEFFRTSLPHGASPTHAGLTHVAELAATRCDRRDDLDLHLDAALVAMPSRYLETMVDCVLDNAFKFSPVHSRVSLTGRRTSGRAYDLTVVDHGRGMHPDQVAFIGACRQFNRQNLEQQGMGLGLSIARRIAELYGGELTLASTPGNGTSVTMRLPLANET
jgi:two-component system, sensor histidine kinase and response regulator